MEAWPVSLQQKLNVDSFQYSLGNTSVRSSMDVGPDKVRARFTDAVDTYSCSILLDHDEVETFKTFYKTTINNGVDQFTFVDPFTEDVTAYSALKRSQKRPMLVFKLLHDDFPYLLHDRRSG